MTRQPRDDNYRSWAKVLAHRPTEARVEVVDRFEAAGVSPDCVRAVLADGGDGLYAAAVSGSPDWTERFGGELAVALLAAEVSILAAHLNSRSSAVRGLAVHRLLEEVSAVSLAAHLGVSRQKIYDIGRARIDRPYIQQVPWSEP